VPSKRKRGGERKILLVGGGGIREKEAPIDMWSQGADSYRSWGGKSSKGGEASTINQG